MFSRRKTFLLIRHRILSILRFLCMNGSVNIKYSLISLDSTQKACLQKWSLFLFNVDHKAAHLSAFIVPHEVLMFFCPKFHAKLGLHAYIVHTLCCNLVNGQIFPAVRSTILSE